MPLKKETYSKSLKIDVIIPHLGNLKFLQDLQSFLEPISNITSNIAFDDFVNVESLRTKNTNNTYFFETNIKGVGPYILRNLLIKNSQSEIFAFQDSDDIPTYDRFDVLAANYNLNGSEMCGSYELRMDYYSNTLQAVRYPLDVSSMIQFMPCHCLLHPTSFVTQAAYKIVGSLSENLKFGSDTQYLLRSFFVLKKIVNVDEFLYIKRNHENSLTTKPQIQLGGKRRNDLIRRWYNDFEEVKNGQKLLKNSSLKFVANRKVGSQCFLIPLDIKE